MSLSLDGFSDIDGGEGRSTRLDRDRRVCVPMVDFEYLNREVYIVCQGGRCRLEVFWF